MTNTTCVICNQPITAGQRRITWINKSETNETTETGSVHLTHLTPPSSITYKPGK